MGGRGTKAQKEVIKEVVHQLQIRLWPGLNPGLPTCLSHMLWLICKKESTDNPLEIYAKLFMDEIMMSGICFK